VINLLGRKRNHAALLGEAGAIVEHIRAVKIIELVLPIGEHGFNWVARFWSDAMPTSRMDQRYEPCIGHGS
jgi:hypothetical protein